MNIKGYVLEDESKVKRAIQGSMGSGGKLIGGVGEDASDDDILAKYDSLAGLITKDGNKVKTGSFYSFEDKKTRSKPQVEFVFRMPNGDVVTVPEGEEPPMAVQAAKQYEEEKKKPKKSKKKAD